MSECPCTSSVRAASRADVIVPSSVAYSLVGTRLDANPHEPPLQTGARTMDDYQDELLELRAAEQDCPDASEDAVEL
ncbi:hypothetical protein FEV13_06255 [Stutzerimonas degradans]|nr:hypothetical protein FEV13_06255 [Stutzerimonas degradans]